MERYRAKLTLPIRQSNEPAPLSKTAPVLSKRKTAYILGK